MAAPAGRLCAVVSRGQGSGALLRRLELGSNTRAPGRPRLSRSIGTEWERLWPRGGATGANAASVGNLVLKLANRALYLIIVALAELASALKAEDPNTSAEPAVLILVANSHGPYH